MNDRLPFIIYLEQMTFDDWCWYLFECLDFECEDYVQIASAGHRAHHLAGVFLVEWERCRNPADLERLREVLTRLASQCEHMSKPPQDLGGFNICWHLLQAAHAAAANSEHHHPAVPRFITEAFAAISSGTATFDPSRGLVVGRDVVGRFTTGDMERHLAALQTTIAHRLLRHLVFRVWLNVGTKCANPHIVSFPGYPELARELGLTGGKAIFQVKAALAALASLELQHGTRHFGLVSVTVSKRSKSLSIELVGALRPGFIHTLRRSTTVRLYLDPLPACIPRLSSGSKLHARECCFEMLLLAEFHSRGEELLREGCVRLSHHDVARLAGHVRLPFAAACARLEAWSDPDTSGRLLRSKGELTFTLARPSCGLHIVQRAEQAEHGRVRRKIGLGREGK